MRPGSVIVDMAAGRGAVINSATGQRGGNCPLTEADKVVTRHGVQLVGYTNLPSMVSHDSSALYARNILDFLKLIIDKEGRLVLDTEDEIVGATLLCLEGTLARAA
jgi:NAD(P) transhydrogenase subunit alpha